MLFKEALGIELPKTSQLSPWWRDRLTDEQIAYAALDAVLPLKLAAVLQPRVAKLPPGPDGKTPLDRLCGAVMPVARMELAGVVLDRDALAKQIDAWDQELTSLTVRSPSLASATRRARPRCPCGFAGNCSGWTMPTFRAGLKPGPARRAGDCQPRPSICDASSGVLPEAALLVRFAGLAQLRSNFGSKLLNRISSETGRLHGNFLLAMAKSGRFSSSKPNLQNIPKSRAMRSVFVAAPGKSVRRGRLFAAGAAGDG